MKLLLRLQLLLLRQTAPDQANGYSILVRGNAIPGRSFITIPIVVITSVLYETKKSMRSGIRNPWLRTPFGPGFTRLSPRRTVFLIRSRITDPIFFNILLPLYALRYLSLLSLIPVLPDNTHSLQHCRLFRDRSFSCLHVRRIHETLLKIAFFSIYKY